VAQTKWTAAPFTVATVEQVASINGLVDASKIDIGDILTIPQPGCCDTHTGHPISVFVPGANGGNAASAATSGGLTDVEKLEKKVAGATWAIVILSLALAATLAWAITATVFVIFLRGKVVDAVDVAPRASGAKGHVQLQSAGSTPARGGAPPPKPGRGNSDVKPELPPKTRRAV
jgi:hypothetical protein|tara:strand:- start:19 stop:543 length:525 start_codon:yes stop_codon:yes gene_type:complete